MDAETTASCTLADIRITRWDNDGWVNEYRDDIEKKLEEIRDARRDKAHKKNGKDWTKKVTWIHIPCNDTRLCEDVVRRLCEKEQADALLDYDHWKGNLHGSWDPEEDTGEPDDEEELPTPSEKDKASSQSFVLSRSRAKSPSRAVDHRSPPDGQGSSQNTKTGSNGGYTVSDGSDNLVATPFMNPAAHRMKFTNKDGKLRSAKDPKKSVVLESRILFMPYFHAAHLQEHKKSTASRSNESIQVQQRRTVHSRRSLDEAAERDHTFASLQKRNEDQVVTKYLERKKGLHPKALTLMVVDQLWLWKLDEDTLVTSFPSFSGKGATCRQDTCLNLNLHLDCLGQEQLFRKRTERSHDAEEMIGELMYRCLTVFTHGTLRGRNLRYFDIFKKSVANQRANCTDLVRDNVLRIKENLNAVREIRDIREELDIILHVVELQFDTLHNFNHHLHTFLWRRLGRFKGDMEKLREEAKDVHDMLFQTLEFQQAELSIRQNQTVLTFTIVTVIFLPLGFISSIFGMNARELSDGSPVGLRTIFAYIFPISIFISVLVFFISRYGSKIANRVRPHMHWKGLKLRSGSRKRDRMQRNEQYDGNPEKQV